MAPEARVRIAGVVLAAGRSTRMGENKLLLPVGGESLLRRAVRAALEGGLDPVLVVVGHEAARVAADLGGLACRVVPNPRHALGLNTSLDAGLAAVPADAAAAVVLLGDMPLVSPVMVRALLDRRREGGAVAVAARYGGVSAPPVVYDRVLFGELRGGEGDGRGREVLARRAGEVVYVDFPASALADVDGADDLEVARLRAGAPR